MINIDNLKYKLPRTNYFKKVYKKTQIVIGHTASKDMNHYKGWLNRHNGHYKNTAAFTIDIAGNIHQHFNPKYFSNFIGDTKHNQKVISIVLENEGWLTKSITSGIFTTWIGDEYSDDVTIRYWRGEMYWANYSELQMSSLIHLIKELSLNFNISLQTIGHNTKVDDIYDYKGIIFRSNFSKEFKDLSPAFNYETLKNKIENYE
jgi:N-acetyl-anhydromuramyl-L-alanine amidase AmpD